VIDVPYAGIWFNAKDEQLTTVLEVRLEALDASGERIWERQATYALALDEDELKADRDKSYRMELPLVPGKDIGSLKGRRLTLHVSVRNTADDDKLEKVLEFRLEP
jgi:hypothetical protein